MTARVKQGITGRHSGTQNGLYHLSSDAVVVGRDAEVEPLADLQVGQFKESNGSPNHGDAQSNPGTALEIEICTAVLAQGLRGNEAKGG
jgi:hypothetical protein